MNNPSRDIALAAAATHFDSGSYFQNLAQLVAVRSESQNPGGTQALWAYLQHHIGPKLAALGFSCEVHDNPVQSSTPGCPVPGPLLVASRHESNALPTVLMYGHGDVVRGQDAAWRRGQGPWTLTAVDDRLYGRGTADNKGQHCINIDALACVLKLRDGRLGFNLKWLFETGEEIGSPGLAAFCREQRTALAADALIASDGPRVSRDRPTVFLGSRGMANFDLELSLREGAHHSGNWGGLLRNPGTVLAHAIASLVDARGCIRVAALRPPPIAADMRAALAGLQFGGDPGDPAIDVDWGEPGLSPAERLIAWNTLEVLAYTTGSPQHPVNAIPASAKANLHMRFVVGTDVQHLRAHVLSHLARHGFADVVVSEPETMAATRLSPDNPWVRFALHSIELSTARPAALLPNLGGSLPNDVFADILGLPTVWVPHSYPGCSQHAPDEHLLASVARQGLQIMAGLYWDLGDAGAALSRRSG